MFFYPLANTVKKKHSVFDLPSQTPCKKKLVFLVFLGFPGRFKALVSYRPVLMAVARLYINWTGLGVKNTMNIRSAFLFAKQKTVSTSLTPYL